MPSMMLGCPYNALPSTSWWRHSVPPTSSGEYTPHRRDSFRIDHRTAIASAGSCFAQNIAKWFIERDYNYVITEPGPSGLSEVEQRRLGYSIYPARFGNIYTALQLLQLIERAYGYFVPDEHPWSYGNGWVDPFRPLITLDPFTSIDALNIDRAEHFAAARRLFEQLDVFIFTLGLTESWQSRVDGAVFPVCPGCQRGGYDPEKYAFVNFGVTEVVNHLEEFLKRLGEVNPRARVILTVSPVPLIATMEPTDAVQSTVYSKSVLRVAAEEIVRRNPGVEYFAAYEIITATFQTDAYFRADRRNVTEAGVAHVMRAFAKNFLTEEIPSLQRAEVLPTSEEEPPEIVCDEAAAYQSVDNPIQEFTSFPREFYLDGQVIGLSPVNYPDYRAVLASVVGDRFTVTASLDAWLLKLAVAAEGRRLIVAIGGSHTAWASGWPLAMAQRLDILAPNRYLVLNVATFGYTLFKSNNLLLSVAEVLAIKDLSIGIVVSLDGFNDVLFRLRGLYRHIIEHSTATAQMDGEDEFLAQHGWISRQNLVNKSELEFLAPLPGFPDYGSSPPPLFNPPAAWQSDLVDRILFALDVFRNSAFAIGAKALNVLQPVATPRNLPAHERRIRHEFGACPGSGNADFYSWRLANRRLLHGGEYLLATDPQWQVKAVLDLDPLLSTLEMQWKVRSAAEPRGYLNLLADWRETGADAVLMREDACHYTLAGAKCLGTSIAEAIAVVNS